jgi:hypothetical protein
VSDDLGIGRQIHRLLHNVSGQKIYFRLAVLKVWLNGPSHHSADFESFQLKITKSKSVDTIGNAAQLQRIKSS